MSSAPFPDKKHHALSLAVSSSFRCGLTHAPIRWSDFELLPQESFAHWIEKGLRMISLGSGLGLFMDAVRKFRVHIQDRKRFGESLMMANTLGLAGPIIGRRNKTLSPGQPDPSTTPCSSG